MASYRDRIPGGRADNLTPREFDDKVLREGVAHEMEHTRDGLLAAEIAMDHLAEDSDYYTKLRKMEKSSAHLNTAYALGAKIASDDFEDYLQDSAMSTGMDTGLGFLLARYAPHIEDAQPLLSALLNRGYTQVTEDAAPQGPAPGPAPMYRFPSMPTPTGPRQYQWTYPTLPAPPPPALTK